MKTAPIQGRQAAFTFWELIAVLAVVALLVIMILPALAKAKVHVNPIRCSFNLKQIALSFKMYANDHDQKFPQFDYSDSSLGNPSAKPPLAVWNYFTSLSNELGSTKILICPQDVRRRSSFAADFSDGPGGLGHAYKQNSAISYFVGLNAEETKPNMMLTGDRNLAENLHTDFYSSTNGAAAEVSPNSVWRNLPRQPFHENTGNYALADGSVQQASNARLQEALRLAHDSYGTNANRFLFPQ